MHPAGGALLKQAAQRLVRPARETDFVAGLEGDEFAVVANNLTDANGAIMIAQTVEEALRQSINLEGTEVFTTASVGITLFPEDYGYRAISGEECRTREVLFLQCGFQRQGAASKRIGVRVKDGDLRRWIAAQVSAES